MIIITDLLIKPIDEGAKVAVFNLLQRLKYYRSDAYIYSINGSEGFDFIDTSLALNKSLIDRSFFKSIEKLNSKRILYIPEASITLFSLIRAKLISIFTGKAVYVLALQFRKYHFIAKIFINTITPQCILTQSKKNGQYLSDLGIVNRVLPLGVNTKKYHEYDLTTKSSLRHSFKIKSDKIVLLHAGHIQRSRNLEWLIIVKNECPEIEIIVVGSTYNHDDEKLRKELQRIGIRLNCDFIPDMTEIYNLADYYIFPVLQYDGAIETPMSVLEAMACNLPIITTEFGSLPDTFEQDNDFHFISSAQEIINIVKNRKDTPCRNREKIRDFTWEAIARKLADIVER